jgi:hypothetical protein
MRFFKLSLVQIAVVAVAAFACGCSSTPADGGDAGGASGPVSFQTQVLPLLERACGVSTACHGDPTSVRVFLGCNPMNSSCTVTSSGPKVLAAVMGKSVEYPSLPFVTPGDPSKSYLWLKIAGAPPSGANCVMNNPVAMSMGQTGCGVQMPYLLPPLSADDMATINNWITHGAMNN